MSQNQKQLESFTAYCKAHPDERFWQALRNWSEYSFIYGSNHSPMEFGSDMPKLQDTFYKN